ncbi:MAG: DNA replication/repair protein RecF [Gammaproteobacteria bacterium]|nr:DNA replication/repair protein RecF [Gammaproteobacteria bacterium]
MVLTRLQIRQLRCLVEAEFQPQPGLNVLVGANGAGKSSVVEAIHLLGYGRSFRGRVSDGLVRTGSPHLEIYAEWLDRTGAAHRAGLRHAGSRWEARIDGAPAPSLTELCAQIAVVTFEPGSHDLIAGGAEHRRRYLDWGLFHVEPEFLPQWRRYSRALKQRNVLLKSSPLPSALDPWDRELAEAGERLTRLRQDYLDQLEAFVAEQAQAFLSELGRASLDFRPGWKRDDVSLADSLLLGRERDIALGYTGSGPHRADWRVDFVGLPGREALSRGQEKLTALACILGQASAFADRNGAWPLVCLDDLASELDLRHQAQVLERVGRSQAQVLLTGTQIPEILRPGDREFTLFHVEQGSIRPD